MIFNINSTRGQTRFLTCVARVTCLVRNKRSTKLGAVFHKNLRTTVHNSAQLRCFENGNDDFGVEAFWIGHAARVGYFGPLNGPLNGHPPSFLKMSAGLTAGHNVTGSRGIYQRSSFNDEQHNILTDSQHGVCAKRSTKRN